MPRATVIGAVSVVLLLLVNNIPASTIVRGDKQLSQTDLYGVWSPFRPLWRWLDTKYDVALIPAELYFSWRYGLPWQSYRAAITPTYRRNYHTLEFTENGWLMTEPWVQLVSTGFRFNSEGGGIVNRDAKIVFTARWPYATHLLVNLKSESGGVLRLGRSSWSKDNVVWLSEVTMAGSPTEQWVEFPLPSHGFDSGLNDFRFSSSVDGVLLLKIRLDDRTPRVPPDPPLPIPGLAPQSL